MEIELDGEPRNRHAPLEESPHATRWRAFEQEIVADPDMVTDVVRIRVGGRPVGELPAAGGGHRFTIAAGGGYRGGDQVEARIHRDARTRMLTLWVDGIEITPISRPPARPMAVAPPIEPAAPPSLPNPTAPRPWVRPVLIVLLLGLFAVPTYLYVRDRSDARTSTDLESKTAECLRRADAEAAAEKAKLGNDPVAQMQKTEWIDDRRRLARISCKEHDRECKRDPRSLPCLLDAK